MLPRLAVGLDFLLDLSLLLAMNLLTRNEAEGVPHAVLQLRNREEVPGIALDKPDEVRRAGEDLLVEDDVNGFAAVLGARGKVMQFAVQPVEHLLLPDERAETGNGFGHARQKLLGGHNGPLEPRIRLHDYDSVLNDFCMCHVCLRAERGVTAPSRTQ